MIIEHHLTNLGKRSIATSVYDDNFLVLDNQTIGPDFTITLPFEIRPARPVNCTVPSMEGQSTMSKNCRAATSLELILKGSGKPPRL